MKSYLLANSFLAFAGQLKLHLAKLCLEIGRSLAHLGPALALGNDLLGLVVESNHELHHPLSLPDGAELIVIRVTVLLQKVFLDQTGNVEGNLVRVRQGTLANKLHNLLEFVRVRQKLLDAITQSGELGEVLFVVFIEDASVLAVRQAGVNRGEMLALGKLLVQTPEDLYDSEGGRADGVGEITTGWRDGTDNGDTALAVGRAESLDTASTLVEGGKLGTEVGGETLISRHFSETTRQLTKSLSPSRGRVGHHGDVETLITEVFGNSNSGVDGSLTGSDGHVGGIGNEGRALHNRLFAAVDVDCELGEILEDFGHFVSAFTTTGVSMYAANYG